MKTNENLADEAKLVEFLAKLQSYSPGTMRNLSLPADADSAATAGHASQPVAVQQPLAQQLEPSEELKRWAAQGLADGSSPAQLFRAMLEQGHPMETCSLALDGFVPKLKLEALRDASLRASGKTPLSLYFSFANIDLIHRPEVARQPDARVQLYVWPAFFTADQCTGLIEKFSDFFQKSTVVDQETTGLDTYRTSSTAYLGQIDSELDRELMAEIASRIGLDSSYAEGLQIQRYYPGEQYKVHVDYFGDGSPSYLDTLGTTGQRTWTCTIYLNDDFLGGETEFTHLGRSVSPECGKAVFWNNLTPLGNVNPATHHRGKPVIDGVKYIVTAWFRERPGTAGNVVSQRFIEEFEWACKTPCDINQHLPFMRELAEQVEHVTEFGVRYGMSTRAFLATGVTLRSYDIELDERVLELIASASKEGRDVSYEQADVLTLDIEPTDLLFIDTWHCYDQLINELRLHADKVSRFLVFHDTQTFGIVGEQRVEEEQAADQMAGVSRLLVGSNGLLPAIIHFLIERPGEWEFRHHFTHNNGLTVLERIAAPD